MINEVINIISNRISGERAYKNVEGISQFHRVQASEGYRQAAGFCSDLLKREGVKTELFVFPADEKSQYWTQRSFQEWNCRGARLELSFPQNYVLADFKADPLSIVQRSGSCDFRNTPKEIVAIQSGNREDFESADLENKIIFISEDPNAYLDWAYKKKVYGIVTDYMSDVFVRQRNDLYDDKLFLSFTWINDNRKNKLFSFILTPREGDKLRKICEATSKAYKEGKSKEQYPRVSGYIDAEFKDGTMEDVVAVIPGTTNEEIVLLAHLCHAKSCANDNASGCGGGIEIMQTLNNLIEEGKLEKPKRTIKMLLVPEVVGTYAYLAEHEYLIPNIKAGIDIDMIGRKQEGRCGLIGIMGVPDSTPSFVSDLAAYITDELSRDVATFNIDEFVTPVHMKNLNYVGGSDHYILCDPTVGIPCIIMMQWLDSNYHSSADTIDKLDPAILKKTCSIAACYLYLLANLGLKDTEKIMLKGRERFMSKILQIISRSDKQEPANLKEQLCYQMDVAQRGLEHYHSFFFGDELEKIKKSVKLESDFIKMMTEKAIGEYAGSEQLEEPEKPEDEYKRVPIRLFRGPITFVGFSNSLKKELKEEYDLLKKRFPEFYGINSMNDFILHRVDGKRNVWEVAKGAAIEGRVFNPEYVLEYLKFLQKAGLVKLT